MDRVIKSNQDVRVGLDHAKPLLGGGGFCDFRDKGGHVRDGVKGELSAKTTAGLSQNLPRIEQHAVDGLKI